MRKKWIFCISLFVGVLLFAGCEFVLPVAPPDDGQVTEEVTDREALRGAWEEAVRKLISLLPYWAALRWVLLRSRLRKWQGHGEEHPTDLNLAFGFLR